MPFRVIDFLPEKAAALQRPHYSGRMVIFCIWQHRTIQREHSARDFLSRRDLESAGVLCVNFPQDRCTDHRIGLTVHNLEKIMDGNLDEVIDALA